MDERKRNIAVGLTAIAGVGGLLGLLLLFGYVPALLQSGYIVTIKLPDAGGLHSDSRVTLRGIDIGHVDRIEMLPNVERDVLVRVKISRAGMRLPQDTRAEVQAGFLGGSTTIAFTTDGVDFDQPVTYLPTDGSAQIEGRPAVSMGRIAGELRALMAEPIRRFTAVAEKVEALAGTWTELGENLKLLTDTRSAEQVDAGEARASLATIVTRLDRRLAEAESVLAGIDAYVNDPKLRQDVVTAVANARSLSEKADVKIDHLADQVDRAIDEITNNAARLAADLGGAIDSMQQILDRANRSDGTLGLLLSDPKLYQNLNDASERLNRALEQLQLLFEKWKDEGIELGL